MTTTRLLYHHEARRAAYLSRLGYGYEDIAVLIGVNACVIREGLWFWLLKFNDLRGWAR